MAVAINVYNEKKGTAKIGYNKTRMTTFIRSEAYLIMGGQIDRVSYLAIVRDQVNFKLDDH